MTASYLKLSSTIYFNLEESKIWCLGKGQEPLTKQRLVWHRTSWKHIKPPFVREWLCCICL